ncbi:MAG: sensor histidine kinase [Anaerolineales bacterium]
MTETDPSEERSPLEIFIQESQAELDSIQGKLKEITMLVEQSQGEVEKLGTRNADITGRLHQMQAHFDTVPREDILNNYEAALDAQQRLFTMRGQLEKLESDQVHLQRMADIISKSLQFMGGRTAVEIEEQEAPSTAGVLAQIIDAQEDERRKISRQIHDGPAQVLSNFILQTEIANRLFDTNPEQAREELANLKEAATASFGKVRDFIFELRPMMLDDLGLIPTVRRYAEAFKEKTGLDISVVNTGTERRLASHREVVLFRAVQECMSNTRDHAQATQVKIVIDIDQKHVRCSIEDNGRGFELDILEQEDMQNRALDRLRRQVEQLDGEFEIDTKPGEGTRIAIVLPE